MRPAVYFGWHLHPWEELLELVRRAETLGYAAAFVDGDVTMLAKRSDVDCLDGWTVTAALLGATERISIGSIRLVHHWNTARLAQAAATANRIAPGRLKLVVTIGDWKIDTRFGFSMPPVGERVTWLDESLDALRALWTGETVTRRGKHVQLENARVRPAPGAALQIAVAAGRSRMIGLVARHADVWEVNLPPVPARVAAASDELAAACARHGRDPAKLGRSMLLFARPGVGAADTLAEYRRLNPWFSEVPDAEIAPGLAWGDPTRCREQLRDLAGEMGLTLPVIDASGLSAEPTRRLLDALAPVSGTI